MKCKCGGDTRVVDSRIVEGGLRRRRLCLDCGFRFSTLETVLEEKPKEPKPSKNKSNYTAKEVVDQIRKKKLQARRAVEDVRYAKEDADVFDDFYLDFDEESEWTSNL